VSRLVSAHRTLPTWALALLLAAVAVEAALSAAAWTSGAAQHPFSVVAGNPFGGGGSSGGGGGAGGSW